MNYKASRRERRNDFIDQPIKAESFVGNRTCSYNNQSIYQLTKVT